VAESLLKLDASVTCFVVDVIIFIISNMSVRRLLLMLYSMAESCLKRSLAMRQSLLDVNHADIAQSLNNLAALYYDLGQYHDALLLYQRALDIRHKVPVLKVNPLVPPPESVTVWQSYVE